MVIKQKSSNTFVGYVVCALIGALVLCGYWWATGRLFGSSTVGIQELHEQVTTLVPKLRDLANRVKADSYHWMELRRRDVESQPTEELKNRMWESYNHQEDLSRQRFDQEWGALRAQALRIRSLIEKAIPDASNICLGKKNISHISMGDVIKNAMDGPLAEHQSAYAGEVATYFECLDGLLKK